MASFGLNAIPAGSPQATLEEVFVPLYLMHRYQVEATTKVIGGMDFNYKIKGDNQPDHGWIPATAQEDALQALLYTISPAQLEVPSHILELIPPRPPGYGRSRETFVTRTGPIFDPIAPAENVVDVTFSFLFEAGRMNRAYLQELDDSSLPGIQDILDQVTQSVITPGMREGYQSEIKLMTEAKLIDHLINLAKSEEVANTVRAIVRGHLLQLQYGNTAFGGLTNRGGVNSVLGMHSRYLADKIEAFLTLPVEITPQENLKVPDGSPIGSDIMSCDFDY